MGIKESPLDGRVVFVIGVARSGTSWLAGLLARHPEITGADESHLFEWGVGPLFENIESTAREQRFLASWIDRQELVDLVRDLCDGAFLRLRDKQSPEARFIVEKTPFGAAYQLESLERKLECYPDAWYVHMIRDPRAVLRSWHERWGTAWSGERVGSLWASSLGEVRSRLGNSPRYREVRYDDLLADPVATMGSVFDWLGARHDPEIETLIAQTAKYGADGKPPRDAETWEHELAPVYVHALEHVAGEQMTAEGFDLFHPRVSPLTRLRSRVEAPAAIARAARRAVELGGRRSRRGGTAARWPSRTSEDVDELCASLADAFSRLDERQLRKLVSPELRLELRTGAGDHEARGEDAIATLAATARAIFAEPFLHTQWVPSAAEPVCSLWFTGTRADGRRVDMVLGFNFERGRITQGVLLCLDPGGRRPSEWDPALEAGSSAPV